MNIRNTTIATALFLSIADTNANGGGFLGHLRDLLPDLNP